MMEAIWKRRNSEDGGFTLVELLVVIAILGILAAVAVFAIGGTTAKSKTAACQSDLTTVQTASDAYAAQNSGTAPSIATLVSGNYLRSAPSTTNGYTISLTAGVATVSPAACAVT